MKNLLLIAFLLLGACTTIAEDAELSCRDSADRETCAYRYQTLALQRATVRQQAWANINATDSKGRTALYSAAMNGRRDTVELLAAKALAYPATHGAA